MERQVQTVEDVVIRFAGDSGDGMQLTGTQFTNTSAIQGNDLSTFLTSPRPEHQPELVPASPVPTAFLV